jgi:hypothetical protein
VLTAVAITNSRGSTLTLPLADTSNGYAVRDIEGLDPVDATLTTSSIAQQDGAQPQNAQRITRNITMKIGLEPNWATETVRSLRAGLYDYLMPKANITMGFYFDGELSAVIAGQVESFDNTMFSADPEVDISIINYDPDFYGPAPVEVEGLTKADTSAPILIEYDGTSDAGFIFTLDIDQDIQDVTITNSGPDGLFQKMTLTGPFENEDVVTINTIPGSKSIVRTRGVLTTSALTGFDPTSTWLTLRKGTNTFRAITTPPTSSVDEGGGGSGSGGGGGEGGGGTPIDPNDFAGPVGCTINLGNYADATTWAATAEKFNSLTDTDMATTISKIFLQEAAGYPTNPGVAINGLAPLGCRFLICTKPIRAGFAGTDSPKPVGDPTGSYGDTATLADRVALANYIAMLQHNDIIFDMVLFQECNAPDWFPNAAAYAAYVAFYGPCYNNPAAYWTSGGAAPTPVNLVFCGEGTNLDTAVEFATAAVGVTAVTHYAIVLDLYSTGYINSTGHYSQGTDPLAEIEAIADPLNLRIGITEMGNSAGGGAPNPNFPIYVNYLITKGGSRQSAGKYNYGWIWFNSSPGGGNNTVLEPTGSPPVTDVKIPGIQNIYESLNKVTTEGDLGGDSSPAGDDVPFTLVYVPQYGGL